MNIFLTFSLLFFSALPATASSKSLWSCEGGLYIEFLSEEDPGRVIDKKGNDLGELNENDFDVESGYLVFKGKSYECSYLR